MTDDNPLQYWATSQSSTIEFTANRREDFTLLGWWSMKAQARTNQLLDRTRFFVDTHWRLRRR